MPRLKVKRNRDTKPLYEPDNNQENAHNFQNGTSANQFHQRNNFSTLPIASGSAKTITLSSSFSCKSSSGISPTSLRITPAINALSGILIWRNGFRVSLLERVTVYSMISASTPCKLVIASISPFLTNLKILFAASSFVLISVSTPIFWDSRIYSALSTSAMVLIVFISTAIRETMILDSELGRRQISASISSSPSSLRISILVGSPLITRLEERSSRRFLHNSLSCSTMIRLY